MKRKKTFLAIISMALVCAAIVVGITYALTTYESNTINKITTGSLKGEIVETYTEPNDVLPGQTVEKIVNAKNTGSVDGLVRLKYTPVCGYSRSENGNIVEDLSLDTSKIKITPNSNYWNVGDDGYYYYNQILKSGETTKEALFERYTIDTSAGNEYRNAVCDIIVQMDIIQASGNAIEKLWNKTYAYLGLEEPTLPDLGKTTVTYISPTDKFNIEENKIDLFKNFKDLTPGVTREQIVTVSNQYTNAQAIYLRAEIADQDQATLEKVNKLLKEYVTITIKEGTTTLYSGPIWGNLDSETDTMKNNINLGSFASNTSKDLNVSLTASPLMGNDYQSLLGNITWVFGTYETDTSLLVHHYIKDTTTSLSPDVLTNGIIGENYTTSPITNDNYTLVATPENATGTLTEGQTVVTYYYAPKDYTLTVHHYIEGTTTKLADDVTSTKKYNDAYTTDPITNDNYTLVATPDNATGTILGNTEVTYYYAPKDYTLTVHHYIEGTTIKLADDVTQNKKYNEAYTTDSITNDNYTLVATPDNATGTITGNTTVTYYYRLTSSSFEKEPEIEKTATAKITSSDDLITYDISYTAKLSIYKGDATITITDTLPQTIDVSKSNLNGGTYNETAKTITWTENIAGIDTIANGTFDISITKQISVKYTSIDFETKQMINNVSGLLHLSTTNEDITREDTATTIIDVKGNIIVHHYLKDTTTKLADDETQTGNVGESYTTSSKTITGYKVSNTPVNKSGKFIDGTIEVTYYYELEDYTLTVHHYIEGTTTKLEDDVTSTKKYNEEYTTDPITNDNYTLVATPDNATGTIKGNTEVTYYYTPKDYVVIVHHYLKDTTIKLADDETQNKKYNDTYTTSQSNSVINDGYSLVADPANKNGTVTGNVEVTYYYELDKTIFEKEPEITKTGTEKVTSKDDTITYTISYNAKIKTYIGDATVTITDTLPEEIVEASSNLDGGTYNKTNKTITWIYNINDINTKNNGPYDINVSKTITIKYPKFNYETKQMINNVAGTLDLKTTGEKITKEDNTTTIIDIKGKVTAQYLIENTTTKLTSDVVTTGQISNPYTTEAKTFDNYTLVATPDNTTGKYTEEDILVTYYYRLNKDNENKIIKSGPDKITNINNNVDYTINYNGKIYGYNGEATLQVTDYLPYEIDETLSNLDGGKYDNDNKTITWTEKINVDKQEFEITSTHNISVKYKNMSPTKDFVNKVTYKLTTNKVEEGESTVTTTPEIKGTVIVNHYLKNTTTKLDETEIKEGLVEEEYTTSASQKVLTNGYKLYKVVGNEKGKFGIEQIVVNYYYEKIETVTNPYTGDNLGKYLVEVNVSIITLIASLGYIVYQKNRKEENI